MTDRGAGYGWIVEAVISLAVGVWIVLIGATWLTVTWVVLMTVIAIAKERQAHYADLLMQLYKEKANE